MAEGRMSRKAEFEEEQKATSIEKKSGKDFSKLEADSKGLFSLCIERPKQGMEKEDVEKEFSIGDDLADIHFTESNIYVRYKSKESAIQIYEAKKDSFKMDIPSVSRTFAVKDKDDVSGKISKLSADTRGFYSIRIMKPKDGITEQAVVKNFGRFGDVADTHFTDTYVYVRYLSWKEAASAIKGLNDEFTLDVPSISASWKPQKSHRDRGPQIYIGNISASVSKEQVHELLEPFFPMEFKFHSINNRNFAFAYFETIKDCKKVIAALNGKVYLGSTLIVRQCRDKSRARYIADDDYSLKRGDGIKSGHRDDSQKYARGQRVTELYVSNFNRTVTEIDLENLFASIGVLAYVEKIPSKPTECCKAFVGVYSSFEAKQMIHKLNQRRWNGLKLNVAYSTRVFGGPHANGGGDRSDDLHYNPVDRAHSLSNKLDIMLDDVLDDCEFCLQVKSVMSDLQQATREIKYRSLRGDMKKGMDLIDELLNYVDNSKSQQKQLRSQELQAFYEGRSNSYTPVGYSWSQGDQQQPVMGGGGVHSNNGHKAMVNQILSRGRGRGRPSYDHGVPHGVHNGEPHGMPHGLSRGSGAKYFGRGRSSNWSQY